MYLVAFARASNPATHSWAQMESFSFEGIEFGESSPSLSIFSPLSTNSLTNVALLRGGEHTNTEERKLIHYVQLIKNRGLMQTSIKYLAGGC